MVYSEFVLRTYRYPLRPAPEQDRILRSWLRACRSLYNGALEERISYYKKFRKSISRYDQQKSLTTLRDEDPDFAEVPVTVLRSSLARLDKAYKSFFSRLKKGDTPGFPRFKSRDRFSSFNLDSFVPKIEDSRIKIPRLGRVRFHEYRPRPVAVLKNTELRLENNHWFLCLTYDLGAAPAAPPLRADSKVIGIDLGLTSFVTLSDGTKIENPRFYKEAQEELKARQRRLSRRKRGSKSRMRAKLLVAKTHIRIGNQRLDFARKLAKSLVVEYDLISHEDLDIRRMSKGLFAKSINDAGWRIFLRCLKCKAEEAGKWVIGVNPSGTTQRCSRCQVRVPKGLSDRTHDCPHCGLCLDRDHNAALNIKALGYSVVYLTAGQRTLTGPEASGHVPKT